MLLQLIDERTILVNLKIEKKHYAQNAIQIN